MVAPPTTEAQSVQLLGVNTEGAVRQEDLLVELLGLHRGVGGLLDQGVDVDFVLVVGPDILQVKYYNARPDSFQLFEVPGGQCCKLEPRGRLEQEPVSPLPWSLPPHSCIGLGRSCGWKPRSES